MDENNTPAEGLKAQPDDRRPFRLEVSVYDPAGTVRREERWATGPGQTPGDDIVNTWVCVPYIVGIIASGPGRLSHRWLCVAARQQIWLGQLVCHGGAAGWPVVGAVPYTPAAEAWARQEEEVARAASKDLDVPPDVLVQARTMLADDRFFGAAQLVWKAMGCTAKQSRDYVERLQDQMKRDTHTLKETEDLS